MEKRPIFEPPRETVSATSEREETTLDRLERQILSARELYDDVQSIPADWLHEEVEKRLGEIEKSVLSKLPLDKQGKFSELQKLDKQIKKKLRSRYTTDVWSELNVLYPDFCQLKI